MACCLLATLFVGGVWNRSIAELNALPGASVAPGPRSATAATLRNLLGRRWLTWLILLALVELGVAILVGTVLLHATIDFPGHRGDTHAEHAPPVSGSSLIVAGATLAVALVVWTVDARPALAFITGLVVMTFSVASWGGVTPGGHAVLMAQLMIVMVIGPALLAATFASTKTGPPLPDRLVRLGGLVAALVFVVTLYAWHLPNLHGWLMSNGMEFMLWSALIGVAFWGLMMNDHRPELAGTRRTSLLLIGVPSGLLGLALLLGGGANHPSSPAAGAIASAVADQRLAGLVMLLVDAFVILPTFVRQTTAVVAPA